MPHVLVVHINKTFSETEKAMLKGNEVEEFRRSLKDMTIKYWDYTRLKNVVNDIVIVAGLRQGRIYSAYKVKGYNIVERLGKNGEYRPRVEFFYDGASYDDIVGLDLKNYVPLDKGGWSIQEFDLDVIKSYVADQGEASIKENREELFNYYKEIGIPYNPDETHDYGQHYYGDEGSSYRRSEVVRKQTHERSNYTCECCGKTGCDLYCHHIELLSEGGEDVVENTMTVCYDCHKEMHLRNDYNKCVKPKLQEMRMAKL